ncbi:MAG: hypothetical protein GY810_12545 [Aureispira sp.]|nr:hypothetical protein [Aureispira sp.]
MKTTLVILVLFGLLGGGGFYLFKSPLGLFGGILIALLLMPLTLGWINKRQYNGENTGYDESTDLEVKDQDPVL